MVANYRILRILNLRRSSWGEVRDPEPFTAVEATGDGPMGFVRGFVGTLFQFGLVAVGIWAFAQLCAVALPHVFGS